MTNTNNIKTVLALLLGLVVLYLMVNSLIDNRFKAIESDSKLNIANQQAKLVTIAETTARNGADVVTESIVKDCTNDERTTFEELLNGLDSGLSWTELVELERLFGRCGSFYSDRKSVMVSRLSREIEVYELHVNQLSLISNQDLSTKYSVEKWQALAEAESEQSKLSFDLVQLQDRIIATLLTGKSQGSTEITSILNEVKETKESLIYFNRKASDLRSELTAL